MTNKQIDANQTSISYTPQYSRNRSKLLTRSSTQKKNYSALLSSQTKREIPYDHDHDHDDDVERRKKQKVSGNLFAKEKRREREEKAAAAATTAEQKL